MRCKTLLNVSYFHVKFEPVTIGLVLKVFIPKCINGEIVIQKLYSNRKWKAKKSEISKEFSRPKCPLGMLKKGQVNKDLQD